MKATALVAVGCIAAGICFGAAPTDTEVARKFLADFCVKCHGTEKQKGDVRLDDLTGDVVAEGPRWAVVLDQVRAGKMPPAETKPQPAAPQREALVLFCQARKRGSRRPGERQRARGRVPEAPVKYSGG